MQIELCFNLPTGGDSRVDAPEWRRKLAAVGDGVLPSWFFGRDEEGNAAEEFPRIRFLGGRRALRVVGFGEEAAGGLTDLMPTLFKLVNRVAETVVPVRMNEHSVSARPSYPRLYHVGVPMLTRRGDRRQRYANDADAAARVANVKKRVVHGLVRQAEFFGIDFPPDDEIDLMECGDYRAKRVHQGFGYGVQYAVVGIPVELKGIWQTGLLLSHGHGAVTAYKRRADAPAAEAAEESRAA